MTRRPYSPNEIAEPRHALPRRLPFCCLRNFTFFGINIAKTLEKQWSVVSDQWLVNLQLNQQLDHSRLNPATNLLKTQNQKLITDRC
jgi:hypothetical protein